MNRTLTRAALALSLGAAAVPALRAQAVDSTLARLIEQGLSANRDLRAATARIDQARAARTGALLDLAPQINAVGGYTRLRQSNVYGPGGVGTMPDQGLWDAGLVMGWDVDVFGSRRRVLQGREAGIATAQEDASDARVLIATGIAGAYYELLGAQERLATARRNAENQRRTVELTRNRLDAGRGTAFDYERARALYSATQATIPLLDVSVTELQNRIGVLVGRGAPVSTAPEAFPVLPERIDEVANADSVARRRPDVRSAESDLAARHALAGAARAGYLPRVSIAATAGYTSLTAGAFANTGTGRYAVGPVVSWPALNLGRVKADVDEAANAEAAAREHYEQSVLAAAAEVRTTIAAYNAARERLAYLEESAAASERAAELARIRYQEGASDFLQVLDAERTLLGAQDQLALGRTASITALVAVHRARGTWPGNEGAAR